MPDFPPCTKKLLRKRQLCAERNELNAQLSQLQKTERLLRGIPHCRAGGCGQASARFPLLPFLLHCQPKGRKSWPKEQAEAYAAAVKHDAAIQQCRTVEQRRSPWKQNCKPCPPQNGVRGNAGTESRSSENGRSGAGARHCAEWRIGSRPWRPRPKNLQKPSVPARRCCKKLYAVSSTLDSAEGWGTWDLFGGGLITDLAKYSKLDEAQSASTNCSPT